MPPILEIIGLMCTAHGSASAAGRVCVCVCVWVNDDNLAHPPCLEIIGLHACIACAVMRRVIVANGQSAALPPMYYLARLKLTMHAKARGGLHGRTPGANPVSGGYAAPQKTHPFHPGLVRARPQEEMVLF